MWPLRATYALVGGLCTPGGPVPIYTGTWNWERIYWRDKENQREGDWDEVDQSTLYACMKFSKNKKKQKALFNNIKNTTEFYFLLSWAWEPLQLWPHSNSGCLHWVHKRLSVIRQPWTEERLMWPFSTLMSFWMLVGLEEISSHCLGCVLIFNSSVSKG